MSKRARVLILSLTNWLGAPRLPRAFHRAGFHVATFAFPALVIQRTHFVDEAIMPRESASNDELLSQLSMAIERVRPDIVVPSDDTSVALLHTLALQAANGEPNAELERVLGNSLGDLRQLGTLRNRKLMAELAASVGVRRPEHARIFDQAAALDFAAKQGYPVVLKEEESVAGMGVAICRDEAELGAALARSRQNPRVFSQGLLAQSFVEGRTAMRVVVAQGGRVLGGLSAIKLETWPTERGPSTCVELIEQPEMKSTAETMLRALGYSGFASLDFMLDGTGRAHLIELNPRPTPISHLGERFGACLCEALRAALCGETPAAAEPRGLPSRVALFPQEWVRSPASQHLAAGVHHDVPWDEPDLVEAYVAIGRGQMRYAAYRVLDVRNEDLRRRLASLESARVT